MNRFMKKTSILIIILTMLVGILNISIAKEYIEIPSNGDISGDITILPIEPGKDDIIIYPGDGDSNGGSNNSGSTNAGNKENTQGTEEVTTKVDTVKSFEEQTTGSIIRIMPERNVSGPSGMFPQYNRVNNSNNQGRKVTLENSRYDLNNEMWTATIDGEIVYCARKGSFVRYGYYDNDIHYPIRGNLQIQGYAVDLSGNGIKTLEEMENYDVGQVGNIITNPTENVKEYAKLKFEVDEEVTNKKYDFDNMKVTTSYQSNISGISNEQMSNTVGLISVIDFDTLKNEITNSMYRAYHELSNSWLSDMSDKIKDAMSEASRPINWSNDIDGDYDSTGPEILVMENYESKDAATGKSASDHWAKDGYHFENDTKTYKNDRGAFILSTIENAYKYSTGKVAEKYTLNDIQVAYWMYLNKYEKSSGSRPIDETDAKNQNGIKLFNMAEKYYTFYEEVVKNNKYEESVTIYDKDAQVIVDRNNKDYIIGPYKIYYPMYEDISYIKDLTIHRTEQEKKNGTGLYYSDITGKDFEIITKNYVPSNGLTKIYPKDGEAFFIKISADKLKDATKVSLSVRCEYLDMATMNYKNIDTNGNIYKYNIDNNITINDEKGGTVTYTVTCPYTETINKWYHGKKCPLAPSNADGSTEEINCSYETHPILTCEPYYVDENEGEDTCSKTFDVIVPEIYMGKDPINEKPVTIQRLLMTEDGERIYKSVEDDSKFLDITIELGGYVWVDEEQGKLSEKNGIKDSNEKVVPGVKVILYKYIEDEPEGEKVTDDDTDDNGKYLFTGLNAMDKYYVEFVYNGQYYQPTIYTSPNDDVNGWGKGNWKTNSNSTDNKQERKTFNDKFASIGDYSYNYSIGDSNRKTFTKEQLLNAKIINEFGILIKTESPNQEEMEMIQYVKDCQISAYTGKDNLTINEYVYDLYPTPDIYNIEDIPVVSRELLKELPGKGIEQLYDAAYYINLGLEAREEADIAVKKDVSKVTLEINGKTHEYTYDTLDAASNPNREEEWNIDVRLSDGYYNKQYTRELYKSDYLYKVSDYGDKAQELGKTEDDELKVFVTYKIMVGNRSTSLRIRPDELVDYYDKDYTYVADRSYIKLTKQNGREYYTDMYKVKACEISEYAQETQITKEGYKKLYIKGFKGCKELEIGAEKIDEKGNDIETIADGVYLEAGETAYIYLTFEVNKDSNGRVILDEEIGGGKENVVEINGYSTQYPKGATVPNVFELDENGNERLKDLEGTTPGRVDRDSNPGNLKPEDLTNHEKYEDDTDKAPNIRIRLYEGENQDRVISGKAWEDERTNKVELTTTGDGIRNEKETLINGVTVQLVEIMNNGTEFVWRETSTGTKKEETPIINYENLVSNYVFTDQNGSYAFKSFIPGNYVVRFIYGDTIKTVAPSSLNLGGLNEKSYNGQDYKSTTYQKGVTQNNSYIVREASKFVEGQEILGDVITIVPTFKSDASNNETLTLDRETLKLHNDAYKNNRVAYLYDVLASNEKTNVSDAKDIASRRNEVTNYSDNNVRNYIAEVLASHNSEYNTMNDRTQLLNDLMQNTKMRAETGLVVVEFEKGIPNSDGTKLDNSYVIDNVDLGLEERPKAQVIMNKEVTNVKLTLADGSILFDANNPSILTPNVVWDAHKGYETGYKNNLLDSNKFASILGNFRKQKADEFGFGFVDLNMDEELMHGATIKISYKMTVQNVGEVDYIDNQYYYTGVKSPNAQVVKTRVDKVIDYVANNLQFYAKDNINWDVIKQEELLPQGLVNEKLKDQVAKYNTVIVTDDFAAELVPALYKEVNKNAQDSISVPLVLTQLISTENEEDDLQYRNIVEIAEISNTAGRRQEYSVVGNQDPTVEPQELDTDRAEVVRILPPYGNTTMYVIIAIITIAAAGIITAGAIFIKKKVLTK